MRARTLSGTTNSGTILNVGTPDFSTGHRSRSTTSTWNSRSQCELTANPLSGKLGADQATIRKRHGIPPCHSGNAPDPDGEVMSVHQAAAELGITASTLYRWLNDGFVPGEQITPGAPWRIRLTSAMRALVADDAAPD